MLMQTAPILFLCFQLYYMHVGLWQVNIMRCNNKDYVCLWQRPLLTCVLLLLVRIRTAFSPQWVTLTVCFRIITTHSHTPQTPTKSIWMLCVFLISLFVPSNISLIVWCCISCLTQHAHTHTHYITSFLVILMPFSWIKTNSGILSSHHSQVYSTGGVKSITGSVHMSMGTGSRQVLLHIHGNDGYTCTKTSEYWRETAVMWKIISHYDHLNNLNSRNQIMIRF